MRISDWSSDVCSSDLLLSGHAVQELQKLLHSCRAGSFGELVHSPGFRRTGLRRGRPEGQSIANAGPRFRFPWPHATRRSAGGSALGNAPEAKDLAVTAAPHLRSEEHTSELQKLMRQSYAVL